MADLYTLPDGANKWLRNGERGVSSETIFSHLTGIPVCGSWQSPPFDPGDLRRCLLLVEAVPAFRAELPRMAELGPHWAVIVEHWDELCCLMDSEVPRWREGHGGKAPRTYERMRQLEADAERRPPIQRRRRRAR